MISRKIIAVTAAAAICGGFSLTAVGASASPGKAAVTSTPAIEGGLSAVSASSAKDAWAVGSSSVAPYLAEHWNGKTWTRVPVSSQRAPAGSGLASVADISATDAWAVGSNGSTALAFRWNGKAWRQVPVPVAGRYEALSSVSGLSADSAWATGSYYAGSAGHPLVLHWNGKAWTRVSVPAIAGASVSLNGVKAISSRNAWAVGGVYPSSSFDFSALILHWNGVSWKRVTSPSPVYGKYGNALLGVTAISAGSAWAVGCTDGCPTGGTPQIERWNGTSWKQVNAPASPFQLYNLGAVTATSASNVWAVGGSGPVTAEGAAIVHWNGHAWTLSGIRNAGLRGVAATSPDNVWAVGGTVSTSSPYTSHILILHWNGKAWTRSV
jgi:hypothetical protein